MKKIVMILLALVPLMGSAQDNTWERIETEPVAKDNPDAKYLVENAVPVVDGKVCWEKTIAAPGKSAQEIYDILLVQMEKMVKEPNQVENGNSAVAQKDVEKKELGMVLNEWLIFRNATFSLDRTQFKFQVRVKCADGEAKVRMLNLSYLYDIDRKPLHYKAEEWITDKYAVNKKHTKLYPVSAKFRRKTIDRKDFIFNKFETLLNPQK